MPQCQDAADPVQDKVQAVRKNPKQPDYEGLEKLLSSTIDESGGLVMPEFDKWISDEQFQEAKTMAAGRKLREEQEAKAKVKPKGGAGDNA